MFDLLDKAYDKQAEIKFIEKNRLQTLALEAKNEKRRLAYKKDGLYRPMMLTPLSFFSSYNTYNPKSLFDFFQTIFYYIDQDVSQIFRHQEDWCGECAHVISKAKEWTKKEIQNHWKPKKSYNFTPGAVDYTPISIPLR